MFVGKIRPTSCLKVQTNQKFQCLPVLEEHFETFFSTSTMWILWERWNKWDCNYVTEVDFATCDAIKYDRLKLAVFVHSFLCRFVCSHCTELFSSVLFISEKRLILYSVFIEFYGQCSNLLCLFISFERKNHWLKPLWGGANTLNEFTICRISGILSDSTFSQKQLKAY